MKGFRRFWTEVGIKCERGLRAALLLLIGMYRTIGTTHLGGGCRFEPSCSEYAVEAAKVHSPWKAARLIIVRILKCRPGGPWGYDPVPPPVRKGSHESQQQ